MVNNIYVRDLVELQTRPLCNQLHCGGEGKDDKKMEDILHEQDRQEEQLLDFTKKKDHNSDE